MPILVDQFGFPVSGQTFLDGAANGRDRPVWATRLQTPARLVPSWDWRAICSVSMKLYSNFGFAKGVIDEKAKWSVGRAWSPRFAGEDKDWGQLATDWLNDEWYAAGSVKGPEHDFRTSLQLDSITLDREGDFFILLTEFEGGYPATQRIPGWRVGNGTGETTVSDPKSAYFGLKIEQGVIYNAQGRPVAYRILGENNTQNPDPTLNVEVSAASMIHCYDPEYHDQCRGWPALTHALNDLRDSMQSSKWEAMALMMASSIGLIEHNPAGAMDITDPRVSLTAGANPLTGLKTEMLEGGQVRYFASNSGSDLKVFEHNRPGEHWESFQDRMIRAACVGVGWSFALVWRHDGANGPAERAEINKCRASVLERQELLLPIARRQVGYAVAKAIDQKILPAYPGQDPGGFLKWDFIMPPKFSIDDGRDSQARREDYKIGIKNLSGVLAEEGEELETHLYARAREVARRKQIQAEISAEMGVHIDDRDMSMLSPNELKDGEMGAERLMATDGGTDANGDPKIVLTPTAPTPVTKGPAGAKKPAPKTSK